jgi:outer membrane protein TolC
LPNDRPRTRAFPCLLGAALLAGVAMPARAQVSFYTAVDLALRNSHEVRMAAAEVQRAEAGLRQTRDAYIPSMSLGSSLGYSYGFPVGQPSVVDVNANSLLFSFWQPDIIRSARASLRAAQATLKDTREKVVTQAALAYTELGIDEQQLPALTLQHTFGERLTAIEDQRFSAGLASRMEGTQTRLTNARLELQLLHLRNHISVLRLRLANLTGLAEDAIDAAPASVPPPPAELAPTIRLEAIAASPAVRSADFEAQSKQWLARADTHKLWRPDVAFGIQYSS